MRAVDDAAVLDHLDDVELVVSVDRELDLDLGAGLDRRAHQRAVDAQVELDPVAGQRIGAAGVDRLEDAGAREVVDQRCHQALAVRARKAGMVVGGADEAEAQTRFEPCRGGVRGPAPPIEWLKYGYGPRSCSPLPCSEKISTTGVQASSNASQLTPRRPAG